MSQPSASSVDTILARLDGEVATIWISVWAFTDTELAPEALRRGLRALVEETSRLRVAWDDRRRAWAPVQRTESELHDAVEHVTTEISSDTAVAELISGRVSLEHQLPFRLTLKRVTGAPGRWMFGAQLHHAIGDAKALGALLERLWQHVDGRASEGTALGDVELTDRRTAMGFLRQPLGALRMLSGRHRQLSRTAIGLPHDGCRPGVPMVASAEFSLPEGTSGADVFFSAILSMTARLATEDQGLVRLRMPVDLRRQLGLGRNLENGCSAVPLEFSLQRLRAHQHDAPALAEEFRTTVRRALEMGVPWATALECMIVARLASRTTLRRGAVPGLLEAPRTNTLVTTFLGDIGRHFEGAPFEVRALRGHTPTWGGVGFTYGDKLVLNLGAFEGLWRRERLDDAVESTSAWIRDQWRLEGGSAQA